MVSAKARTPTASYSAMAAGVARFSPNSEMSAPETKARSPAPVTMIARTVGSALNASMMRTTPCHIAIDTALCRAGWLKIIQPIAPSVIATIRSLPVSIPVSCLKSPDYRGTQSESSVEHRVASRSFQQHVTPDELVARKNDENRRDEQEESN